MMTEQKYKELSIKEFTKAAEVYDSGHAGLYEMCKDDYPPVLEELKKIPVSGVVRCWLRNRSDDRTFVKGISGQKLYRN